LKDSRPAASSSRSGTRQHCEPPRLWLLLFLVAALAAACTSQPPHSEPSTQRQTINGYSGSSVKGAPHPIGAKWDWARVNRFAPYLRDLSGGLTFYIVVWCDVERQQGRRDWSEVDEVGRSTRALGYSLLLKIRTGSCWATGGQRGISRGAKQKTASAMPRDLGAYQEFVREVVRRYSAQNVHDYALENEPNARKFFWDGTAEEYERLVTLGASAIRSVDPRARVLDGGLASAVYGTGIADHLLTRGRDAEAVAAYQRYYVRRADSRAEAEPQVTNVDELRTALDGEQSRRNLEMLAATLRLARNKVIDAYQLHFYEPWDNLPALLGYLHDVLPPAFPIEAWEVGMFWHSGPDDERARAGEVTKAVVTLLAGGVRRVIWLPLAYNPENADERGEIRYGLLDPDGRVRQAGAALKGVAKAADGMPWRAVATDRVTGIAFGRGRTSTLLLWSDQGVDLPVATQASVRLQGMDGSQLPRAPGGLRLTSEPVFITVAAGLKDAPRVIGIA
jgi:Glycosyl hydrolases family 39